MRVERGAEVTLDRAEQELCTMVARMRSDNNRREGVQTKKLDGNNCDITIDRDGFGAEMAFAKLCNTYPDFTTFVRSAKVDRGDIILHDGRTVDIKQTNRINGRLIAPIWKHSEVDLYALMVGTFPRFVFRGVLPKSKFIIEANLRDMGRGVKDTYAADQANLEDLQIEDLQLNLQKGTPHGVLFVPCKLAG